MPFRKHCCHLTTLTSFLRVTRRLIVPGSELVVNGKVALRVIPGALFQCPKSSHLSSSPSTEAHPAPGPAAAELYTLHPRYCKVASTTLLVMLQHPGAHLRVVSLKQDLPHELTSSRIIVKRWSRAGHLQESLAASIALVYAIQLHIGTRQGTGSGSYSFRSVTLELHSHPST